MNDIGFTAMTLGNHEFDWGLDKIAKYKDGDLTNGEANFPFLGANIFYKGTNRRPDWIDPYTIVDYNGLKVGIVGVVGGTQESSILALNVAEYDFLDEETYTYQLVGSIGSDPANGKITTEAEMTAQIVKNK